MSCASFAQKSSTLSDRKPANRLIIATAGFLNVPVLTSDQAIRESELVRVIWE